MQFDDVLTIRATAQRCKAEGMPVAERALRCWIKSGKLPAVWTGKKALLYFPNVRAFLEKGALLSTQSYVGGVRRVEQ